MINTKFKKGNVPWNKGLEGRHLSPATEFKKGREATNKKPKIKKTCSCGKVFYVKPSLDRIKNCSYHCARVGKTSPMKGKELTREHKDKIGEANKKNFGKNHGNYKHGRSKELNAHYQSSEYKNWRKNVFLRDDYTCVECEKTNTYINAHHVLSLVDFPEYKFDINNGETLCLECHKNKHRRIIDV